MNTRTTAAVVAAVSGAVLVVLLLGAIGGLAVGTDVGLTVAALCAVLAFYLLGGLLLAGAVMARLSGWWRPRCHHRCRCHRHRRWW